MPDERRVSVINIHSKIENTQSFREKGKTSNESLRVQNLSKIIPNTLLRICQQFYGKPLKDFLQGNYY